MISALVLALICLIPDTVPGPYVIEAYSVRADGAGMCDCTLAPCGVRAPGCVDEFDQPCPLLVEPDCFLGSPDQCGNLGACSYLDFRAFPWGMVWHGWDMHNEAGCIETDLQEVRVGWSEWWRVR